MLHESRMLRELQRVAWANGEPLCLYGDPAYPLGIHLQAPFRDALLTPQMQRFNEAMSEVRGIGGVDVWNRHQLLLICRL